MSDGPRHFIERSHNKVGAMDRRGAGFESLPDDCVAAVLALVPFRER